MSEIVDFLLARLAEDEESARAAIDDGPYWLSVGNGEIVQGDDPACEWSTGFEELTRRWSAAEHIARHDPARVLAEVEAKRRIVQVHRVETETVIVRHVRADGLQEDVRGSAFSCVICGWVGEDGPDASGTTGCDTLRLLALPYADHPDYRQEWRP